MENLDDIENPIDERFRALHERINKLDLAFAILRNDLSKRVSELESKNIPTRRQLNP